MSAEVPRTDIPNESELLNDSRLYLSERLFDNAQSAMLNIVAGYEINGLSGSSDEQSIEEAQLIMGVASQALVRSFRLMSNAIMYDGMNYEAERLGKQTEICNLALRLWSMFSLAGIRPAPLVEESLPDEFMQAENAKTTTANELERDKLLRDLPLNRSRTAFTRAITEKVAIGLRADLKERCGIEIDTMPEPPSGSEVRSELVSDIKELVPQIPMIGLAAVTMAIRYSSKKPGSLANRLERHIPS